MKREEKRFLGWNVLKMRGTLVEIDRDLKVEQREHFFPPNDSVKIRRAALRIRSCAAIRRHQDDKDENRFYKRPKYVGRGF